MFQENPHPFPLIYFPFKANFTDTLLSHTALPFSLLPCRPLRGLPWRWASPSAVCRRNDLWGPFHPSNHRSREREPLPTPRSHRCSHVSILLHRWDYSQTHETARCAGCERALAFYGVGGSHVTCGDSLPVLPSFLRWLRSSRGGGGGFLCKVWSKSVELEVTTEFTKEAGNWKIVTVMEGARGTWRDRKWWKLGTRSTGRTLD